MKILSILILTAGLSIQSRASTVFQVTGNSSGISTEQRCSDGIPKGLLDQYTEQSTENAYEQSYVYCTDKNILELKEKTVQIICQKSMAEGGHLFTPWITVLVKLNFTCDSSK